ncbi:MAG: polysaccharide export protein [Alphaproteobacteria bacterium]|nr:polysaccharide export protein [Alphaproteobacteria bacterium]
MIRRFVFSLLPALLPALFRTALVPASLLLLGACAPANLAERASVGAFEYRIGTGDRLHVTTYGEDRLTGDFGVGANGAVAFPLLGPVQAAGKTLGEFNAELQRRLASEFMRNPRVAVEMINFRPVYILGEVQRPGEFPYGERMSVYALVAKAGGFTYRASEKYAYVRAEHETAERAVRLTSATAVQPGDTIRIPERNF